MCHPMLAPSGLTAWRFLRGGDMELTRTCSICSIEKSISEFAKDKRKPHGREYRCWECKAEYTREYCARWRKANPGWWKNYSYGRYESQKHPPGYMKDYYRKNRDKFYIYEQRYRAAKNMRGLESDVTKEGWTAILDKYEHRCLHCGTTENLTMDHIVPLSISGLHLLNNLQPLCGSCNSRKHTKCIDYRPDVFWTECIW